MTLTIAHFKPEDVSSEEASKVLASKSSHYKIEYFVVSSVAGVPRDILAYSGADWEDKEITNWPAEKNSPFGVFPVLHIHAPDGKHLRLCESIVVDQFLAKKFGLLGDNEWDEQQIKMFYSSSHYLRERLFMRVTWNYKEVMDKAFDKFMSNELPLWIETHTKHLKDNGSNGHYVGSKLSLADIQTANSIDHIQCIQGGDKILAMIKSKSPEIWKVKEAVDSEPRLQKWRQSEGYLRHLAMSKVMYANTGI
ncbi:Glutathione S-transferase S1 [Podila clonocystis]|nr:Glutathione S-transferase S1 [Podila clonocystis]